MTSTTSDEWGSAVTERNHIQQVGLSTHTAGSDQWLHCIPDVFKYFPE